MIYMGLDASSSCTGICIFNDRNLIYYNKIKPKDNVDFRHNTCEIIGKVVAIAERYKPDYIFMEDIPKYARKGSRGGSLIKPVISLGAVQGVFYYELVYKHGYKIRFVDVYEWRQELDLLKGERKREEQKDKAIKYVNKLFGLNLYYVKGKKSVKDDDDIAEAICIVVSQIK
jgi:Holliday junction resolvasome RuvABC endonuclease subunit